MANNMPSWIRENKPTQLDYELAVATQGDWNIKELWAYGFRSSRRLQHSIEIEVPERTNSLIGVAKLTAKEVKNYPFLKLRGLVVPYILEDGVLAFDVDTSYETKPKREAKTIPYPSFKESGTKWDNQAPLIRAALGCIVPYIVESNWAEQEVNPQAPAKFSGRTKTTDLEWRTLAGKTAITPNKLGHLGTEYIDAGLPRIVYTPMGGQPR